MPLPKPVLIPEFSAAQLAVAQQIAAQTSVPHRRVLRARLTVVLAVEPTLSHREVAHRAGVALGTVRKWRRRWARDGWSLDDAPRSGRPPTFSPTGHRRGQSPGV
jgi:hypothetical protein